MVCGPDVCQDMSSELLKIMFKNNINVKIWGEKNTKRPFHHSSFWNAWNEVYILASEVVGK